MHIAVRFMDGTTNLLSYTPSDEYTTEVVMAETRAFMEKKMGKPVRSVLVQVIDNPPPAIALELA